MDYIFNILSRRSLNIHNNYCCWVGDTHSKCRNRNAFFDINPGGGFKCFLLLPLFGEMIHFAFSIGLEPPTRYTSLKIKGPSPNRHQPRQKTQAAWCGTLWCLHFLVGLGWNENRLLLKIRGGSFMVVLENMKFLTNIPLWILL